MLAGDGARAVSLLPRRVSHARTDLSASAGRRKTPPAPRHRGARRCRRRRPVPRPPPAARRSRSPGRYRHRSRWRWPASRGAGRPRCWRRAVPRRSRPRGLLPGSRPPPAPRRRAYRETPGHPRCRGRNPESESPGPGGRPADAYLIGIFLGGPAGGWPPRHPVNRPPAPPRPGVCSEPTSVISRLAIYSENWNYWK